ncbi:MAG TPA: hypothetical protein VFY71_05360 [Planctomycetota bacterium]|nr:hypothetical protein [Planctomycetota bacterium]
MSSTNVSTKPGLDGSRPGAYTGWEDAGLVEAALEGRLTWHDAIGRAHLRARELETNPAATPPAGRDAPLHVHGSASQVPTVRLVQARCQDESPAAAMRARTMRAIGLLAIIVVTLVVADVLS